MKKKNILNCRNSAILPEEIDKIPKIWNIKFSSEKHSFYLSYMEGKVSLKIEYIDYLPDSLTNEEKNKFTKIEKLMVKNKKFTFECGDFPIKSDYLTFSKNFHVAKSRFIDAILLKRQFMGTKFFTRIIKKKRILFYSGGGISSSEVWDLNELKNRLGIDENKEVDIFVIRTLYSSNSTINIFKKFCDNAFNQKGTTAHHSLNNICRKLNSSIFTENFDLLHERSGIQPYHLNNMNIKGMINPDWFKGIDIVITLGLSRDYRGFLTWYKRYNMNGRIIAINLEQPKYLDSNDFFLKGDLQKILPELEGLICKE